MKRTSIAVLAWAVLASCAPQKPADMPPPTTEAAPPATQARAPA